MGPSHLGQIPILCTAPFNQFPFALQSVFAGLHNGLGVGAGALVAGSLWKAWGGGHMFALMAAVLLLAWALGLGAGLLASKRASAAQEAAAHEPAPETRLLAARTQFET